MALSYVGGVTGTAAGSTTADLTISLTGLTGGSDSAPSEGDFVIVTVCIGASGETPATSLVTSGYTSLTQLFGDDTQDCFLQVHHKFMGSTPDTEVVVSRSGNINNALAVTVQVFRGVDPTTPMDVTPVSATGINTGRPNPGAITPVTSGAWIVVCSGSGTSTGVTFTYSYLTNLLTVNSSDADDATIGSGYYTGWTSGSYDPAASTTGSTSTFGAWCAYTLALRPDPTNRGSASFTLGTMTLSATISKGVVGAGVFTLGAMTVSSDGDVLTHGAANFTLGSIGGTRTGTVAVAGASSFTLGAMTLVSEGTGPSSHGDAAFTLGALTLSSDGDVAVAGSGAATFAAMTLSSDGDVAIVGSGSATFANMTASGAGSVTVAAAGAFTFDAMTMTAEGQVIDGTIDGDGAFTLDACTIAAAGVAVVAGAFARTLADMTVEGTIELSAVPINGIGSFTLESMTASGDGDVFVVGAGAFTLGQMTLESSSEPLELRGIDAFTAEFRPGDIDDRIHNFLLFYTTGTDASWTNKDLWMRFLSERGFSDGSLRDRLKEFLKDYLGLSGERSLHDLWGLITGPYAE